MNRNHHARRRRRLAAVHFVISVKLLVPQDKEGGEFIILRGRKTKQNDAEPDPEAREQIGLQAVTNGARTKGTLHDGNNGFVVTESAPEKRSRLAWTFDNAMHQYLKSIWDGISNIISNKY